MLQTDDCGLFPPHSQWRLIKIFTLIQQHPTSEYSQNLQQLTYSSRRPHCLLLLSAKNSKLRLQFTKTEQDWKNVASLIGLNFCCNIQMMVRIWCEWHESMSPSCLVSTVQAGLRRMMYLIANANNLKLDSWIWKWVHWTQMASIVTRSQSNMASLGCDGTGDSKMCSQQICVMLSCQYGPKYIQKYF